MMRTLGINYMIDKEKHNIIEYKIAGDWVVLAGKTDDDNDYLSLKLAHPNDYWFHVRGMPGSHVILRVKENEEPSKDIIKEAAAIAAWHSKAKGGGITPVSCTIAKYVSKPKGAKPGTVTIKKETVIKVRPGIPEIQ
jgi:predicted ribosome quality control (RQC) complex YloA/Tae2 family protein